MTYVPQVISDQRPNKRVYLAKIVKLVAVHQLAAQVAIRGLIFNKTLVLKYALESSGEILTLIHVMAATHLAQHV